MFSDAQDWLNIPAGTGGGSSGASSAGARPPQWIQTPDTCPVEGWDDPNMTMGRFLSADSVASSEAGSSLGSGNGSSGNGGSSIESLPRNPARSFCPLPTEADPQSLAGTDSVGKAISAYLSMWGGQKEDAVMLLNCLQAVGRRAFSLHSSVAARVLGVTIDSLGEYLDEDLVEGVDYCYRAAADSAAGAGPELFFSINGFQCKLLRPRPSRPPSAASLRIYSNLFESLRLPPGADMPLPPPSLPRLDHCLFSCSLSQKQPLPAALAVMQRSPAGRATRDFLNLLVENYTASATTQVPPPLLAPPATPAGLRPFRLSLLRVLRLLLSALLRLPFRLLRLGCPPSPVTALTRPAAGAGPD